MRNCEDYYPIDSQDTDYKLNTKKVRRNFLIREIGIDYKYDENNGHKANKG